MNSYRLPRSLGARWLLLLALLLAVVSCYPGEPESIQQLDTVATLYDDTVDFTSFNTYAMPDSVNQFCPDTTGQSCIDVSRDFDQLILQTVATNMQTLGYSRDLNPDPANPPDLVVTVGVTASDNWVVYNYYPGYSWWGWYPCCWGPGWGYGYPSWGATNYKTGTVIITMLDSKQTASDVNIPVVWEGALNGLLGTQSATTQTRLVDGINQAFDQSPYLKTN